MSAVTLAELELLRHALMNWRFKLADRVGGNTSSSRALEVQRELLARHRVVIANAATGVEVPSGQ